MRNLLMPTLAALAILAFASDDALAGQIWTDGNGDGLPDALPLTVAPNTDVTIGVWVDAQSFTWTNYLAYVEWTNGNIQYVSAAYVVTGGSNFPVDDFSHPNGVGLGGSGFNQGGVDHIGNVTLRIVNPFFGVVTPIIDIYNPFYVFSQLGAGAAYQLFTTNPGTTFGEPPPPTGACCFPDRSCAALTEEECAASGGVFMGLETLCGEVSCGPPFVGACCLANGTCQIMIESDCVANGGAYAGNDATCEAANCPGPTGACCLPDGTCLDRLEADVCASDLGGTWYADQLCAAVLCDPTNSIEPKTWGKIKSVFR